MLYTLANEESICENVLYTCPNEVSTFVNEESICVNVLYTCPNEVSTCVNLV